MLPAELFRCCPRCGAARSVDAAGPSPFRCAACGLVFYFNPTVSAAGWLFDDAGRVLMTRRLRDPARGKFGIPGGFVDIDETAEGALRRETREEVGLEIADVAYLTSFPNRYLYEEVLYPVVDLVFTATALDPAAAQSLDGVAAIEWHLPADLQFADLAFPSMRESLKLLTAI